MYYYIYSEEGIRPKIYFEISSDFSEKRAVEFIVRAFSDKKNGDFDGLILKNQISSPPDELFITKRLVSDSPNLVGFLQNKFKIKLMHAPDSFSMPGAIVNRVKVLEQSLRDEFFTHHSNNSYQSLNYKEEEWLFFFSMTFSEKLNYGSDLSQAFL